MRKIAAVAWKELLQIGRDPFTLLMLLGIPTFMLLLYGYALNFDVRHVRMAVEDRSRSSASRDLIASFVHSTYFDLVADLPAGADLARLTERRQAKAILVIPESFEHDLEAGNPSPVQLIVDGTDATTATTALGYASAVVAEANLLRVAGERFPRGEGGGAIDLRARVWYNPELRSTQFIVPGLVGFILMLTAVLSTALSVVRERERGTMEQLRVSPLRSTHLLVGKTLPYLAISLFATALIFVAARVLFGVVVKGSYLELLIVVLVYLSGALGLGLLVSSISISQAMAFQVGSLISMLPAIFLSGFIFPIRSMPPPLRLISLAIPARYFLVILRGIVLKGASVTAYPADMAFLMLNAIVVVGLAWFRLTRQDA